MAIREVFGVERPGETQRSGEGALTRAYQWCRYRQIVGLATELPGDCLTCSLGETTRVELTGSTDGRSVVIWRDDVQSGTSSKTCISVTWDETYGSQGYCHVTAAETYVDDMGGEYPQRSLTRGGKDNTLSLSTVVHDLQFAAKVMKAAA